MQIVKHYGLKGLEEILLEVIVPEFFLQQEFISELSQGVYRVQCYIEVLV